MIKGLLIIVLTIVLAIVVYYNRKIMSVIASQRDNYENLVLRLIGARVSRLHTKLEKIGSTHNKTTFTVLDDYFDSILVNLDMKKDNVTTTGFMLFIFTISVGISLLVGIFMGNFLLIVLLIPALAYFTTIGFKFVSIIRFEKKEALIMDAEDLLATDIVGGGVYNAIKRYTKNIHPDIQVYFEEFLDNIQSKNMSFRLSMMQLNDRLGRSFDGFAQKSMMYEESDDENMDDMFSSVIDKNRRKRDIREKNNQKFNELRVQFLVSFAIISVYFGTMLVIDANVYNFFIKKTIGNVLLIIDVLIVTAVMAYLASIKASFLD